LNQLSISVAGLNKSRIEALTDGIFATVMTVLVLSLSIPSIISASGQLESYVLGLGPVVLSYVMSFLILAVFWVRHHNLFHYIKYVDTAFIWLNIAFLLTVGFIPFSTELIGRAPNLEISSVIYGANLIATGICTMGIWFYASRQKLLIADRLDEDIMNSINKRLLGGPLIYLSAILISYFTGVVEIAIVIYVGALAYYVLASSLGLVSRAGKLRKAFDGANQAT
jgi:uncharacterized membrane protein